MPDIGLEISDILIILRNKTNVCMDGETNGRVQSILKLYLEFQW